MIPERRLNTFDQGTFGSLTHVPVSRRAISPTEVPAHRTQVKASWAAPRALQRGILHELLSRSKESQTLRAGESSRRGGIARRRRALRPASVVQGSPDHTKSSLPLALLQRVFPQAQVLDRIGQVTTAEATETTRKIEAWKRNGRRSPEDWIVTAVVISIVSKGDSLAHPKTHAGGTGKLRESIGIRGTR